MLSEAPVSRDRRCAGLTTEEEDTPFLLEAGQGDRIVGKITRAQVARVLAAALKTPGSVGRSHVHRYRFSCALRHTSMPYVQSACVPEHVHPVALRWSHCHDYLTYMTPRARQVPVAVQGWQRAGDKALAGLWRGPKGDHVWGRCRQDDRGSTVRGGRCAGERIKRG